MTHDTTPIVDCFGRDTVVDTAMAPLLTSLWDRGWRTLSSCQGPGRSFAHGAIFAHVMFVDVGDVVEFAQLCRRPDTARYTEALGKLFTDLSNLPIDAMVSNYEITRGRRKKTAWEVKVMVSGFPHVGATVFFEATDLPYVIRALA